MVRVQDTENSPVSSTTILKEVRARVLALVKNPPAGDSPATWKAWSTEVHELAQLEMIYSRPEIIPLGAPEQMK